MLQRYRTLDANVKGRLTIKSGKTSIESDCKILDKFKNELLSDCLLYTSDAADE